MLASQMLVSYVLLNKCLWVVKLWEQQLFLVLLWCTLMVVLLVMVLSIDSSVSCGLILVGNHVLLKLWVNGSLTTPLNPSTLSLPMLQIVVTLWMRWVKRLLKRTCYQPHWLLHRVWLKSLTWLVCSSLLILLMLKTIKSKRCLLI